MNKRIFQTFISDLMRLPLVVLSPILRCDDHHDGDKWPLTSLCTPLTTAQVMIMTTMMVIMIIMIMAITYLQFSLQPSPQRPGAQGRQSPVTWWQVVPLDMNIILMYDFRNILSVCWCYSETFRTAIIANIAPCSSLRHELVLMCDFRCNMSRGWCFSGTSLQLRFYTSVGANSSYNNVNNYLCVLKISPLDRSTSQSNQNPTCDDNNNIEYFYSIICGDLGDGKDEDWGAKRARLGEIMVNISEWWRSWWFEND